MSDKITYYEINEEAARRAKEANSYYNYVPGSATAEYRTLVDEAHEVGEHQKKRVDPMYHEKIDNLIDRYARKLADNINEGNIIDARVPSIMIAGPSNFPVRQKEKQNAARDRNMGEYREIKGILDRVHGTGKGGISADDPLAVEKLENKLAEMKEEQAFMKSVNAYFRKHNTLDGCPELSAEQIGKLKADMSSDWHRSPVPYHSFHLSNNNANMRRVQQRINSLKNKSEYIGWQFEGGRVETNEGANRLQILFDEKPSAEQRTALKSRGFRWAPSESAWQRQLNGNAIYAADRLNFIQPITDERPSELQPKRTKVKEDPDLAR